MSSSLNSTVPLSGTSSPAMMRSRVVLPDPDGPSSATSWPAGHSTETLSRATKSPNRFDTLVAVIDMWTGYIGRDRDWEPQPVAQAACGFAGEGYHDPARRH